MTIKDIENFDTVINKFDYAEVAKVMECLNWSWYNTRGVPTKEQMIECIYDLTNSILQRYNNEDTKYCTSGGFYVKLIKNDNKFYIEIMFVTTTAGHWN